MLRKSSKKPCGTLGADPAPTVVPYMGLAPSVRSVLESGAEHEGGEACRGQQGSGDTGPPPKQKAAKCLQPQLISFLSGLY